MSTQYDNLSAQYESKPEGYYGVTREEMLPFLPATARKVLDVGCGGGGFGVSMKKFRKDITQIWGIEPNKEAASIAEGVYDKVICSTFDENVPELADQKFDAIIFNDVLEHLIDPQSILKVCKKYLAEGGCIVASIPNILYFNVFFNQIILKQDWEYTGSGILDNTHLRFFTKKSIIRLFEETGYRIATIEGINANVYRRYRLINFLALNKMYDWRFLQYAVVAKL